MSELYVYVKADSNDADYVTTFEKVSTCEELDLINRVANAVAKDPEHRWFTNERWDPLEGNDPVEIYKDYLSEDDVDLFNECYIPYDEYGIHTIEEIKLLHIESMDDLLHPQPKSERTYHE